MVYYIVYIRKIDIFPMHAFKLPDLPDNISYEVECKTLVNMSKWDSCHIHHPGPWVMCDKNAEQFQRVKK